MGDIDELRSLIDRIDKKLVKLLNERAHAALQIAKLKNSKGLPIYAPDREASVLDGVARQSKGPLLPAAIRSIYREIISTTRAMEKVLVVSYLGPAGTFTHQAARDHFGTGVQYSPSESIEEVFQDVLKGKADVGVVPIENSTGGVVSETLDTFMSCGLKICDEIIIEIHHNLVGRCTLEEVKKVCSKPEAIAQCRRWLSEHLSHADLIPVASTTAAAQEAARESGVAAIASREAAELYQLEILAENVEDHHENVTRFVVLGRTCGAPSGRDRTSIMFAVKNRVGALYEMLLPFKLHGINLTKIESRPSRTKAWDYIFFVDIEGHSDDPEVKAALKEVEEGCRYFQLMGSYPRADVEE
jgi:chorismate mutase/prephenate dehydratase